MNDSLMSHLQMAEHKLLADDWKESTDPTAVLEPGMSWAGKTVFKLQAVPTGKRINQKSNLLEMPKPRTQLRILEQGTSGIPSKQSQAHGETGNFERLKKTETFGSENFKQLVSKLRHELDPDTGLLRT